MITYKESEKLLSMEFEAANNYLISKRFEYTSAKDEGKEKWIYYRRLDNNPTYEIGILIVDGKYINGVSVFTRNFYEANIYKKELETNYKIDHNQLDGQNLVTRFIHKEYIFKRGVYTVIVAPNGSGEKGYYIYLLD